MKVIDPVRSWGWRGAMRELALIVAGVVIAMWLGSLASARSDRARERANLRELLTVTRENERRVNQAMFEDSITVTMIMRVIDAVSRTGEMPRDSVALWYGSTLWYADFYPLTGVYSALIQSGDLGLIRNSGLRSEIATVASALEGAVQQLRGVEQHLLGEGVRATAQRLRHSSIRADRPITDVQLQRLRADSSMMTHFEGLRLLMWNHLYQFQQLRVPVSKLRESLEEELRVPEQAAPTPRDSRVQ